MLPSSLTSYCQELLLNHLDAQALDVLTLNLESLTDYVEHVL